MTHYAQLDFCTFSAKAVVICSSAFLAVESMPLRNEQSLVRGLRHRNVMIEQRRSPSPLALWFDQQVDHFDPLNQDTFKQQYFINDTYWRPGGPVFFVLGGEGPISPGYVNGHFVVNTYAQLFDALIVACEHRFYGYSSPHPTLDTKHLHLLTTEQALADYANFRQFIAAKYNTGSSKWISFGGSYSGSLSAWLRLKYPQLIDGAIATSAPVEAQLDFTQYLEVVSASIGPACSAIVKNVTQIVTQMIANGQTSQVESLFNTCDPISSELDIATFMESLTSAVSEIVQYNNDNNNYSFANITTMCDMLSKGNNQLQAFADLNNKYNDFNGDNCTTSSYEKMIGQMQETQVNGPNAATRLWTWQCCTEYAYFQTGQSALQPFSDTLTLDYFIQQCTDTFGPPGYTYQPNIDWIINEYGGKNIQTSQTIFPNGLVDPWHVLGVMNTTSSSVYTITISTGAHCSDLYPPLPTDSDDLVLARRMEIDLISTVIYS
ncbi:Putative serine protease [Cavenderia fasciculata]|uniref:Serine protease n=1 Tax=Cavenderia fasciculata TaxID=261658 RepID=F4PNF9_CACFS|nr:Putative serine protease [Cavenderia fasciculata]EGG23012.1 Putative serine protease [Cavenderia fasciculata]|eukprot:XP_004360863.1 Putative serine protease [Cavenderia fasciculata]